MAILKIDNSRTMDSHESAYLKVTSPTNKTIYLYKRNMTIATDTQREIFWKFCNDCSIRFVGELEATIEEMKILLEFSKL